MKSKRRQLKKWFKQKLDEMPISAIARKTAIRLFNMRKKEINLRKKKCLMK